MFELILEEMYVFPMDNLPPVGQSFLILQYSRSHSGTPQSVGLLFTSDQPVVETTILDKVQHSQESLSMTPAGFEPPIPALERLQTHALDRAATGMDKFHVIPF
jgi:hypothetical protein